MDKEFDRKYLRRLPDDCCSLDKPIMGYIMVCDGHDFHPVPKEEGK